MPPGFNSDSDLESVLSLQIANPKSRRNSTGPKYFCSVDGCGESFKRLDHLDRHEFKHTGIKKHACHYDNCSKTYSILTHLKRHIKTTHERASAEITRNIRCEVDTCTKLFTSLSNMHRHLREVHENPKVYECQFCNEKFRQKLKMKRHEINKHTGVYPFNCDKCSRSFHQEWQWKKHEETCKVYPCPSCDLQFDKWTLYLKHCKETQHSKKYYKCEYCEKMYAKPSELQKHVGASHLDPKQQPQHLYKCDREGCNKTYSYERNLRQHIQISHEGKKYICSVNDCEKVFSSEQNLQKHLGRDHQKSNDGLPSTSVKRIRNAEKCTDILKKRKKRKDAGTSKTSNLAKLSGLQLNKDINEKLKMRDEETLREVSSKLSEEMSKQAVNESVEQGAEDSSQFSQAGSEKEPAKDKFIDMHEKKQSISFEDLENVTKRLLQEMDEVLQDTTVIDYKNNDKSVAMTN